MALLSTRQRQIVSLVAQSPTPLTGQQLAFELGCSLRTVQAEVNRINRDTPVIVSSNRGYRIVHEGLEAIRPQLEGAGEGAESLEHAILKALLLGPECPTVDDLSVSLARSSSVIERHLTDVRKTLDANGLSLARDRGRLSVEGPEVARRLLLGQLITTEASTTFSSSGARAELDEMDHEFVVGIVSRAIHRQGRYVEPGYESGLHVNVAIALYRLRSDAHAAHIDGLEAGNTPEERIASDILSAYAGRWTISPTEDDRAYVAMLLHGLTRPKDVTVEERISDEIDDEFVRKLESLVSESLAPFRIAIASDTRLHAFALHVHDLIRRAESGQATDTGLLETIRQTYPFVYEAALLVRGRIAQAFGVSITDGELGFICVHLGMLIGAVEHGKARVAVVADSYGGIAASVLERLVLRFGQEAVFVALDENTAAKDSSSYDFIVATHPVRTPSRVVSISPFFGEEDSLAVERALLSCAEDRVRRRRGETGAYFDERLFFRADREGMVDGTPVRTMDEAISYLAARLEAVGIVDETFEASVRAREEAGSTCFFELFAIPHAMHMDARRTAFCLLLSERGVEWDGSLIHVVLMIAVRAEDRPNFMSIFDSVVKSLRNGAKVAELVRCHTLDEFTSRLYDGL